MSFLTKEHLELDSEQPTPILLDREAEEDMQRPLHHQIPATFMPKIHMLELHQQQ